MLEVIRFCIRLWWFFKDSSTLQDTAFFHILAHKTDRIFMKILPEIKLRTRKSPLNSVNDPDPPWWRSELSDCSCYAVYCFGFPWWKGPGAMWLARSPQLCDASLADEYRSKRSDNTFLGTLVLTSSLKNVNFSYTSLKWRDKTKSTALNMPKSVITYHSTHR